MSDADGQTGLSMPRPGERWSTLLALLLGIFITLILRGYQFGGGNHSVYLIQPLREVQPELLKNDWWVTHTLQYHIVFNKLTAGLMRLGVEKPAFLMMYLGLVVLLHIGWLRIVRAVGLGVREYVLSVVLYYLSAGGTGLGTYLFLQDSSFLPGNVANIAMLWGIALWIERRIWRSALCLGVAGLFHLNHAIVAIGFFALFSSFECWRRPGKQVMWECIIGMIAICVLSMPNILPAAHVVLTGGEKLPLPEFVALYAKLRHPHHYDPVSWPIGLWISFLWVIPLSVLGWRWRRSPGADRAAAAFLFFMAILAVAFVFAGVWFVSESLIQMSLFRFSIYPKLLSCIGAAAVLLDERIYRIRIIRWGLIALPALILGGLLGMLILRPASAGGMFVKLNWPPLLLFVGAMSVAVVFVSFRARVHGVLAALLGIALALGLVWRNWLGLKLAVEDRADADYLALCDWARQNTPVDALFLVPPNEQLFRFHARRAIIVNFKNVPQLSTEMPQWRDRLQDVLDLRLADLPRRFDLAHAHIEARYDALPREHLQAVARKFRARYVITARPWPGALAAFENSSYHLYHLLP